MANNIARHGAAKRLTEPKVAQGHRPTDHAGIAPTSMLPGKAHTQPAVAGNDRHRHGDAIGGSAVGENLRAASRQVDHALGQKILDTAYAASGAATRATRRVFVKG